MMMRRGFWLGLLVLNCSVLHSIKLVKVTVPDIVQSGSQVILTCLYTVSPGEYIDSIKWYLNTSECYRIVPGLTKDRVLTFPPGGDCISLPQSGILKPGLHRLVVSEASRRCSGQYICQVTESRPPFKTEQDAGRLTILERPLSPPELTGLQHEYQQGSLLNVSCQTSPGYPPPSIAWSINGQEVRHFSSETVNLNNSGLALSRSRLMVKLTSADIPSRLEVKCSATTGQLYSDSVTGQAVFTRASPDPVLGEPLMSDSARVRTTATTSLLSLFLFLSGKLGL